MIAVGNKFKSTEIIPSAGRYRCVVCGLIVEIAPKFIDMKKTFFACPICHAGLEGGPKGVEDEVREFIG